MVICVFSAMNKRKMIKKFEAYDKQTQFHGRNQINQLCVNLTQRQTFKLISDFNLIPT